MERAYFRGTPQGIIIIIATRQCKTKTARNNLESRYGCHYSVILDLPYFDPVRMTIIDPMHNLYLGSAKHVLKDRTRIDNH